MKLSIITVVLNDCENLSRTIDSIRAHKNKYLFEYIIIDGHSSDNTLNIIKDNSSLIDFFITEKDDGVFDAMNKGITHSSGDFLWFLNAGDTIFNDPFEFIFENSINNSFDIIHGQTLFNNYPNNNITLQFDDLNSSLLKKFNYIPHPSTLINKNLFINLGYFNSNYKIASDYDFFCRLSLSKIKLKAKKLNIPFVMMLRGGLSDYKSNNNFPFTILKELFLIQFYNFGFFNASLNLIKNFLHFSRVLLINYNFKKFYD